MSAPLARFPWRFSLVTSAAVLVLSQLPSSAQNRLISSWIQLAIELLLAYAALLIGRWLLLELPEHLGLWRGPAKILQDLLLLGIATGITVVLVQQRGQVNLIGLVTTSAVLTAVVGLAAQETLKDLFAGITLQLDPPFREGDWIDLGEVRGTVSQLSLMNTELESMDGSQIVLSNSAVAQTTLRRFRPGEPVGLRFNLDLDQSLPPSKAIELLQRVLELHPGVLAHPQPQVWVGAYGDAAITYEVMAFHLALGDRASFALRSALLEQIWYALERADQSLPLPVRELRRRREIPNKPLEHGGDAIERRAALLALNPLLGALEAAQRTQLASQTRSLRFGAGEVVVREGEPGDALFQVIEGRVCVLKQNPNGPAAAIAELGPGDVFGEMTLCADEPRNATVQALEQTVLLEVERQDLLPLIDADPELLQRIATLVAARRSQLDALRPGGHDGAAETLLGRMQQLFAGMRKQND